MHTTASVERLTKGLQRLAAPRPRAAPVATPAGHVPKVRRPDFEFDASLPTWWYADDPFRTLLLAALSATFPPGERFFIDSVRHYRDQITDPELSEAIRAFMGQEAHHARGHKALNGFLEERGLGLRRLEQDIQKLMDRLRTTQTPERQLAHTVAVEHFTALLAEGVLLANDELDQMDPRMAKIWAWHAVEESEHKAVAFDVYKAIGGSEFVRITEMMSVSVLFPLFTAVHLAQLMKEAGELTNLQAWRAGLRYLLGKPGVLRETLPSYLRFYSPRFHPWSHDARAMVERAKQKYLGDWA